MSLRLLSDRKYSSATYSKGLTGIVPEGLLTHLDNSPASYGGTGTTWTNLVAGGSATLIGSPTFNSATGFTFNGSSQRATFTRNIADDFTICCWFKTSSTAGGTTGNFFGEPALVNAEVGGVTADFGLSIGNGVLVFGAVNTPGQVRSTAAFNNNAFHFAAVTRTKATGTHDLYMNGVFNASATGADTQSLTAPTVIGIASNAGGGQLFNGTIGAVMIYNRVLSAGEVTRNYDESRGWFGA